MGHHSVPRRWMERLVLFVGCWAVGLAASAGGCATSAAAPGSGPSAGRSQAQGASNGMSAPGVVGPVRDVGSAARDSAGMEPSMGQRGLQSPSGGPRPLSSSRTGGRPGPSAGDPLSRARLLLESGRLEQAASVLGGLVQGYLSGNKAFEAAGMLGRLWLSRRLYTKARKLAERMEQARPTDPAGFLLRSRAEELLGHSGRAMRAAQKAARLAGNNPRVLRRFAETLLAYGKAGSAAQVAGRALALQPDSAWTLVILGDALWSRRRYAQAAEAYRKAASLGRDGRGFQAMALDRLGTLYQKRRKPALARQTLARCRREFPKLGCPFTEAGFMRPDPTRPERGETYAIPRGQKRRMQMGGEM